MRILFSALFLFSVSIFKLYAQNPSISILTSGTKTSLRGLSVVTDNIIWVSGSNGTVGRSTNAGKNWKWFTVKGFEKTDFRDIEGFDANVAIIMSVAEPAYILKTIDAGETWKIVYENKTKGMFLDAMDFANNQSGVVIGDPVDGKIFGAYTNDTGNTWTEWTNAERPVVDTGEAFLAASGSNLKFFENKSNVMVSGGKKSRLFTKQSISLLPVLQGKESTGTNAIDVYDNGKAYKPGKDMIIVGGDFSIDTLSVQNCFYTKNAGKNWIAPLTPPHGYRSSVEYLTKKTIITCGLTGVDYSIDGGKNWRWISREGFHVCKIAKNGSSVFLAGSNGKIGKLLP